MLPTNILSFSLFLIFQSKLPFSVKDVVLMGSLGTNTTCHSRSDADITIVCSGEKANFATFEVGTFKINLYFFYSLLLKNNHISSSVKKPKIIFVNISKDLPTVNHHAWLPVLIDTLAQSMRKELNRLEITTINTSMFSLELKCVGGLEVLVTLVGGGQSGTKELFEESVRLKKELSTEALKEVLVCMEASTAHLRRRFYDEVDEQVKMLSQFVLILTNIYFSSHSKRLAFFSFQTLILFHFKCLYLSIFYFYFLSSRTYI